MLAPVEHVVVAVAHGAGAHARRRRCRRRPPRGSTTPGTRPPRPAATYFCFSSSEPWSSTGVIAELRDEREQRRRRADRARLPRPRSRARGCRRPGRRTPPGTAGPANPASRHASQLAHGILLALVGRRRVRRDAAPRRAGAPTRAAPRTRRRERTPSDATSSADGAARGSGARVRSRRHSSISAPSSSGLQPQQRVGDRVDERAPARVVVRGFVHEHARAARRTSSSALPS